MKEDLAFRNANVSVPAAVFSRMEGDLDFVAGFQRVLVHPARVIHSGLYISSAQCVTTPFSSLVSKFSRYEDWSKSGSLPLPSP